MIILGDNQFYIKGLICTLYENTLNSPHPHEGYRDIRIYVLSGMSLFNVHHMLADSPPSRMSIFILNERQALTINTLFPDMEKHLIPENTHPEALLRDIISAARISQFCTFKSQNIGWPNFTPLQSKITSLITKGSSTSYISRSLNVNCKKALAYRYSIFKKMRVKNLIDFYYRWYSLKNKRPYQGTVHIIYEPQQNEPEEDTGL